MVGFPDGSDSKESAYKAGDWVWSCGWEDPLEEGMATHCSILAWEIPWTEEPGRLQSTGLQRVRHDWATKHSTAHTGGGVVKGLVDNVIKVVMFEFNKRFT